MLTLWDLIKNVVAPGSGPKPRRPRRRPKAPAVPPPPDSMEALYERVARDMLQTHGVRVRRWRQAMTGIAWQVRYRDGTVTRLIEAPRPRGPMSAAVFLHEIGHHVIGFNVYKPRCLEEFHAWDFALRQMEVLGLNITESVLKRRHLSLLYAVSKARRRGLQELPPELEPYARPWPDAPRTIAARTSARPTRTSRPTR
jgi:hypothetical protein